MTELCGTFDAAKADWSKLFGESPKSIDDIDVIGLHDKTIGKKREFVAIDRVLEIIDEENNLSKLAEETPLGCGLNDTLAKNIKNRVLALKGEQ